VHSKLIGPHLTIYIYNTAKKKVYE
jgi:hypothetical protein